jgi:hypothetical protein
VAELGDWLPNSWQLKPAGMVWEDWQAWGPWLRGPGQNWPEYAYDIPLFTQPLPPGESDPAMIKMWMRNTAKRIDAVGHKHGGYTIFEARRFAGWSAIAQLLGYRDLWLINFPTLPLGDLWLITERIDDATRSTAVRQGIKVWSVGEQLQP